MSNRDIAARISAGTADPDAVAEWVDNLTDAFLMCRDLGHPWKPYTAKANPDGGFDRTLKCPRCKAEKSQVLTSRGVPAGSQYKYRDGYQAPRGAGAMDADGRGALRLVSTLRLIDKAN